MGRGMGGGRDRFCDDLRAAARSLFSAEAFPSIGMIRVSGRPRHEARGRVVTEDIKSGLRLQVRLWFQLRVVDRGGVQTVHQ